ncbi:serine/threonine protein kinase, putative, partial [Perkinsus marinus ATCC 50983]
TIGEGTFGKVKLGTHVATGERVAVKILEKARIVTQADAERVTREIRILRSLRRSPHVVQLFEIMETPEAIFMVMEYASGGELFDYIVENGKISESEACKFIRQIISGVCSLHMRNVVHRDLKPENLLLDKNHNIIIADLGLSNFFHPGEPLQTACGSPCYAPPEMVAGLPYDPPKCDVWSVGVVLYAMVCGQLPFEDHHTPSLYKKILEGVFKVPNEFKTSREVRRLIFRMLTPNPNERPSFEELRRTDLFLRG